MKKFKKRFYFLLLLICLLPSVILLSACGASQNGGGDDGGSSGGGSSGGGGSGTGGGSSGGTLTQQCEHYDWQYQDGDEEYHWSVCDYCHATWGREEHSFNSEHRCVTCYQEEQPTFIFEKNATNDGYKIVGYDKSYLPFSIKIPSLYNGLPVKEIGAGVFAEEERDPGDFVEPRSITIPNSVEVFGERAFENSTWNIIYKNYSSVALFGDNAFKNCSNISQYDFQIYETSTNHQYYLDLYQRVFEGSSLTDIETNKTSENSEGIKFHLHPLTLIEGVPATCTQYGRKDYYKCENENCSYVQFADEEGHEGIDDLVISIIPHEITYHEATQSTCSSYGYSAGEYCSLCERWISGHEMNSYKPQHSYDEDHYCVSCGNHTYSYIYGDIEYRLNEDEESYSLHILDNFEVNNEFAIANEINGKPVTAIVDTNGKLKNSRFYTIWFGNNITSIPDGMFEGLNMSVSFNVRLGRNTESIGKNAFKGTSIYNVTCYNKLKTIGEGAFYDSKLYELTGDYSGLETIEKDAFKECQLIEFTIPKSLKTIDSSAFAYSQVRYLKCSDYENTSMTLIGENAFDNCTSLLEVTLPSAVQEIEKGVFGNCSQLTKVLNYPDNHITLPESAFYQCTSLSSFKFPSNLKTIAPSSLSDTGFKILKDLPTTLESISMGTMRQITEIDLSTLSNLKTLSLSNCEYLTTLKLPQSLESLTLSNQEQYAMKLTAFSLPSGLKTIGELKYVYNLGDIEIPSSVESIGKISYCNGLTSIRFNPSSLVKELDAPYNSSLKEVWFSKTFENIKEKAFIGSINLQKIKFLDLDGSELSKENSPLKSVGAQAFYQITGLEEIDLGDNIETIGNLAFYGCTNLKKVYYGNKVKTIGRAFEYTAITDIVVPSTETYYSLEGCSSLKTMTIPYVGCNKGSTSENIESMFNYKDGVELPSFEKITITGYEGGYEFDVSKLYSTHLLSSLEYHLVIGENVTSVISSDKLHDPRVATLEILATEITIDSGAFDGSYYKKVIMPIYSSFTKFSQSFSGSGLKEVVITASASKTIPANSFASTSLEKVTIEKGITAIGDYAFANSSCLTTLNFDESSLPTLGVGVLKNTGFTSFEIPNGYTELNGIFEGCSKLTQVTFPTSLHTLNGVFVGCSALSTVELPENITNINGSFKDCSSLEVIILNKNRITSYGASCFENCIKFRGFIEKEDLVEGTLVSEISIPSLTIGKEVTSLQTKVFAGCSAIKNIVIPKTVTSIEEGILGDGLDLNIEKLTLPFMGANVENKDNKTIKWLFASSSTPTSLKEILLDSVSVIKLPTQAFYGVYCSKIEVRNVSEFGDSAFYSCQNLEEIKFDSNLTSILDTVFANCPKLASFVIPDTVTTLGTSNFTNCSSLKSVTIGSGVKILQEQFNSSTGEVLESITLNEGLETLGQYAFANCIKLTEINLPSTLKTIGYNVFNGCTGLEEIVLPDGLELIDSAFRNCSNLKKITLNGEFNETENFFEGCGSLTKVHFGKNFTPNVYLSYALKILQLAEITVDSSDGCGVTIIDGSLYRKDGNILYYYLPLTAEENFEFKGTTLSFGCFNSNQNLLSISLSTSFTSIAVGDSSYVVTETLLGGTNITTINYEGSMEDWNSLGIEERVLSNITIVCSDGEIQVPNYFAN